MKEKSFAAEPNWIWAVGAHVCHSSALLPVSHVDLKHRVEPFPFSVKFVHKKFVLDGIILQIG